MSAEERFEHRGVKPTAMRLLVYKELERLLKTLDIEFSVDKAMDIAKTISTVTFSLNDGTEASQFMLITPEQRMLAHEVV